MLNKIKQRYRYFLCGCLAICLVVLAALIYQYEKNKIPDEIHVASDARTDWKENFSDPLISWDAAVETSQNGNYRISCRLLGTIPLKTVKVSAVEPQQVYASGSPVGIYMETRGILVIDSGEITDAQGIQRTPAAHIIQPGDYIQCVNGIKLTGKKQLIQMVRENEGEQMELEVLRQDELIKLALTPVLTEDGTYKLGIWVRDNIQGIGTMTYIRANGEFAALGHSISDVDTGEQLAISKGELYDARILSVQKGAAGNPGELRGIIDYDKSHILGEITANTGNGIMGKLAEQKQTTLNRTLYTVGMKQEIQTGEAQILCDVGNGIQTYRIEITEIDWNARDSNKSFMIHVVDERLMERTGGIVQGMSGSPIIQDGKLMGAVTHVLVNDPTRGYGIFIENMLEH